MKQEHFGKPVFAIVNSFSQFVPGHTHMHQTGQIAKKVIESYGYYAAEFNTIAIDDGIAMGHDGMLYSLPSREIIADSIEYMCNAHKVDAMLCITNCDKITPGMLMATMRLNIPTVFFSGGPMESGVYQGKHIDLVDAMIMAASDKYNEKQLLDIESNACPTCGSCSGLFTANSMNALTEALGFALPGNGTIVATHKTRMRLLREAAATLIKITEDFYYHGDENILPRNIACRDAFLNAMTVDIAMGGSTNTILHLLAIANEADADFSLYDIDTLSRKVPNIVKVAPSSLYHIEDVNRAGGIMSVMGELRRAGLLQTEVRRVDYETLDKAIDYYDIAGGKAIDKAYENSKSHAAHTGRNLKFASQETYSQSLDLDREKGCIRSVKNAYSSDGGLAVLFGNLAKNGAIVKTAGVDKSMMIFRGNAVVFESQEAAIAGILGGKVKAGDVVVIRYEGPKGGPGMQEMLYPTSYLKSIGLDKKCALITDGRFSGGTSGLSIGHISPEAAAGGEIAFVRDGDVIEINIPGRKINLIISSEELARRKKEEQSSNLAYKPKTRNRKVSKSLVIYSAFVSSADKGAVRLI